MANLYSRMAGLSTGHINPLGGVPRDRDRALMIKNAGRNYTCGDRNFLAVKVESLYFVEFYPMGTLTSYEGAWRPMHIIHGRKARTSSGSSSDGYGVGVRRSPSPALT